MADGEGGLIWITGFSAAGKTTVGRAVAAQLREQGRNTIFLDGDDLRSIFGERWGYEREQRVELAHIYFRLCSHLAAQGNVVVISAIAMYEEIREWVAVNVPRSIEVYLKVPENERRKRDADTKKIYGRIGDVAQLYDEPKSADLVLENYGEQTSADTSNLICAHFLSATFGAVDMGRTQHWKDFYSQNGGVFMPSPFAESVGSFLNEQGSLLEIGCGNGRDAAYLSSLGQRVTAIDLSEAAIDLCREQHASLGIDFRSGSLADLEPALPGSFDHIYTRFVIHAMPIEEEVATLQSAWRLLRTGGLLHVECRSINDPMARLGEVISPTERIHGHYRRFIILDEFMDRLSAARFDVENAIESDGLAIFGDEDPVVIRITARKR